MLAVALGLYYHDGITPPRLSQTLLVSQDRLCPDNGHPVHKDVRPKDVDTFILLLLLLLLLLGRRRATKVGL